MTVVLDTSVLAAFVNVRDPHHARSRDLVRRILRRELGAAVTSDLILAEGMNLLWKRAKRRDVSEAYASLFFAPGGRPPVVELRRADAAQLQRARDLHLQRFERRQSSFTDAVLAVLALDLGAPVASFDGGFDGIVPRIH